MKTIVNFFCLLMMSVVVAAQNKSVFFDEVGDQTNWGVNAFKSKIRLFVSPDTNTKSISPYNALPTDPLGTVVYLNGATTVKVTTRLRKDSISYYRYSVIENDTAVKVWDAKLTKVDKVWNKRSSLSGYLTMDLGLSLIKDKKITIKIYRLPRVDEVSTLIVYNKPFLKPKLLEAYLVGEGAARNLNNLVKLKGGEKFVLTDSTGGIFLKKQKTDIDFAQHLLLIYENGSRIDTIDLGNNWSYNSDDGNPIAEIDVQRFKVPGNYEILFKTSIRDYSGFKPPKPVPVFKFTVLAPPLTLSALQVMLIIFVVIILALVVILGIRRANKKKQLALSLKVEKSRNELSSVRAQLNPHFIFNALSGIQSLMNNNEVEQANNYLGKFANLTREILDERELISIADEIALLRDYLAMEQLRFPFTVIFTADEEERFRYTEIPTMLLQPFIENAVKHGIASLKKDGEIKITIKKQDQNIVLSVQDNGKGFIRTAQQRGLGLKLSEKRIALLNETYKDCPIMLFIDSEQGTTVQITLTNWLT